MEELSKNCIKCKQHEKCRSSCISGYGNPNSQVMFILDKPDFSQDRFGDPLGGDIRHIIQYLLEKAGWKTNLDRYYFTFAIKCGLGKKQPTKKILNYCMPFLEDEIRNIKPKLIIAMGRWGLEPLTGQSSIKEFRGHFLDQYSIQYEDRNFDREIVHRKLPLTILPMYTFSSCLSEWTHFNYCIHDLKKAKDYLKTGVIPNTPLCKYTICLSKDDLDKAVDIYTKSKYITTDTETTGLYHQKDDVINFGYSNGKEAHIIYVREYTKEELEFGKKKWPNGDISLAVKVNKFVKENKDYILQCLKTINSSQSKKIGHNLKFDLKFAKKEGVPYKNFYFDTIIAEALLDENNYKALNDALERNNINFGPYDTQLWKYTNKNEKKRKPYSFVPPELLSKYLAMDVYGDYLLFRCQVRSLKLEPKLLNLLFKQQIPLAKLLAHYEYKGFKVDLKLMDIFSKILEDRIAKKLKEIRKFVKNDDFNPSSTEQLSKYFEEHNYPFEKLHIKMGAKAYSVGKDTLAKFKRIKKYAKLPEMILDYRALVKLKGTYVDGKTGEEGLLSLVSNSRIYPTHNIAGPVTGRLASSSPSVQVFPKEMQGLNIRNFFIPDQNWVVWEADFKTLELKIIAGLSKELTMIHEFQNNIDLHSRNTLMFNSTLHYFKEMEEEKFLKIRNFKKPISMESLPQEKKEKAEKILKLKKSLDNVRNIAKCFDLEMRVPTNRGYLKFRDLLPDNPDKDWIYSPENLHVSTLGKDTTVNTINNKYVDKLYTIRSNTGEIKVDGDHILYVWRNCGIMKIKAHHLKIGDSLLRPRKNIIFANEYVSLNKFKDINIDLQFRTNTHSRILKTPTFFNEHLATIIGYIVAEGSSDSYAVSMNGEDIDSWRELLKAMRFTFGQDSFSFYRTRSENQKCKSLYTMTMDTRVKRFIEQEIGLIIGEEKHCRNMYVPEIVFRSPKSVIRSFLRAFMDGDAKKGISLEVSSKQLRDDVNALLNLFGIYSKQYTVLNSVPLTKAQKEKGVVGKEKREYYGLRMYSTDSYIYTQEIGFIAKRKLEKYGVQKITTDSDKFYGLENKLKELRNKYRISEACSRCKVDNQNSNFGERLHKTDESVERNYSRLQKDIYILEDGIRKHSDFVKDNLYRGISFLLESKSKLDQITEIRVEDGKFHVACLEVNNQSHSIYCAGYINKNCLAFGKNYGLEDETIADNFDVPIADVEEMSNAYFEKYNKLSDYMEETKEKAIVDGVFELSTGRKRRFTQAVDFLNSEYADKIWKNRKQTLVERIQRQALNFPVQGEANEVYTQCKLKLFEKINRYKLRANLGFSIHDGMVNTAHIDDIPKIKKLVAKYFQGYLGEGKLKITLDNDFEVFTRWKGDKIYMDDYDTWKKRIKDDNYVDIDYNKLLDTKS